MSIFLRQILAIAFGLATSGLSLPAAQVAPQKAPPVSDRCLFIVETSTSMERRQDAMIGAVQDLLTSGLGGKFHEGGTVGIWTFNKDLSAGQFPLQMWSVSRGKNIAERAWAYLKGQEYRKEADFSKVVPALERVVKDSDLLTVVLITSGDRPVVGTPYDAQINESYERWRDKQEKARAPFVTILRVRKGQFAAYTVNTPPWPIQVPQLAEENKEPDELHARLVRALHPAETSSVPPLILSGKQLHPETKPAPKPEVASTTAPSPASPTAVPVTNDSVAAKPAAAAPPPAEIAKADPAPPAREKAATEVTPKPAPVPVAPAEPKAESAQAPEAKTDPPAPVQLATAPAAAQSPVPTPAAETAASVFVRSNAAPAAAPRGEPQPPPAQAAVVTPPPSLVSASNISAGAVVLAVGLLGIAVILIRRRRRTPLGSLITQVIEREKGP